LDEFAAPTFRSPEPSIAKPWTEDGDAGGQDEERYFQLVQIRPKRKDQDGDETPDDVHIWSKLPGAARLTAGFGVPLA
jgi:hypothetical protein